ncbi:MAG TPA: biopolymer transporter ExbD [Bacteroidetes bacterium]|nr:biopolymer transporter ExbD [Bacteroidota bacterium]
MKFNKKRAAGSAKINTASLPDIVFMLLFFFMVATTMREVTIKVKNSTPSASEVEKLTKKNLVSYIYVGAPVSALQDEFGTATRLQLNDAFKSKDDVRAFVETERNKLYEDDKAKMIVSIKADRDVKMGIITDVKQELRKANALKLTYSTRKKAADDKGDLN